MLRASQVFFLCFAGLTASFFFGVAGIFLSFRCFFLCTLYFSFFLVCSMFLRFVVFKSSVFFIS